MVTIKKYSIGETYTKNEYILYNGLIYEPINIDGLYTADALFPVDVDKGLYRLWDPLSSGTLYDGSLLESPTPKLSGGFYNLVQPGEFSQIVSLLPLRRIIKSITSRDAELNDTYIDLDYNQLLNYNLYQDNKLSPMRTNQSSIQNSIQYHPEYISYHRGESLLDEDYQIKLIVYYNVQASNIIDDQNEVTIWSDPDDKMTIQLEENGWSNEVFLITAQTTDTHKLYTGSKFIALINKENIVVVPITNNITNYFIRSAIVELPKIDN